MSPMNMLTASRRFPILARLTQLAIRHYAYPPLIRHIREAMQLAFEDWVTDPSSSTPTDLADFTALGAGQKVSRDGIFWREYAMLTQTLGVPNDVALELRSEIFR